MFKLQVTKRSKLWWSISAGLLLASFVAMGICFSQFGAPLRLGLDFLGGTRLQLELACGDGNNQPEVCRQPIDINVVRAVLADRDLDGSSVQLLDRSSQAQDRHIVAIRSQDLSAEQRSQLVSALEEKVGEFDPAATQIDTVGPVLGQQILTSGILAIALALAGIIAYLSVRFQFDYAIFAIIALFHDVLITAGAFAWLGWLGEVEVDTLFVVALLTIIGFSVNDTVVIYDRIRETLRIREVASVEEAVDLAVDETLTRSINTTVSPLLAVVAIFLFGVSTLRFCCLSLIIGFLAGAYSSIFVASTLLAWWRKRTGFVPQVEKAEEAIAEGEMEQALES